MSLQWYMTSMSLRLKILPPVGSWFHVHVHCDGPRVEDAFDC